MTNKNTNSELRAVKEALKAAGRTVMEFYGTAVDAKNKDDKSPVTAADLASEKILLQHLQKFGYGILSEESEDDSQRLHMERVWIMDPLDGTKDFLGHTGDFTIMVGLVEKGEPILTGVYKPDGDQLFYAKKGGGAFVETAGKTKAIFVSKKAATQDWRLLVSRYHLQDVEIELSKLLGIQQMVKSGSAGLKSCLVASSKADLYINSSDKTFEWDLCAAELIVREAGGMVTDMDGQEIMYNKKDVRNHRGFIVSNGKNHNRVVGALKNIHERLK